MTLPSLLLAIVLSTLYGAGFHLVVGGGSRRMLFYLVAGWIGFFIGHLAGNWFGVTFGVIGPLNAGAATLSSVLTLILARWLLRAGPSNRDGTE